MALQVWLPLTKDLRNQGLSNVTVTNNGATFNSAGKLGGCYQTDGSHRITISSFPWMSMKPNYNFSLFLWVKGTTTGWLIAASGWELLLRPTFIRIGLSGNGQYPAQLTDSFDANTWYHLGFTWEGTTGKLKLYLNGSNVATSSVPSSANFDVANPINLTYDGPRYLSDFRIYDHCLSPMEVKELSKGLVLHYPLNRQGWGQENLLSRYVVPGQAAPTSTAAGGRTTWLGDYKITIPASENADTYFRLFTTKQLTTNAVYTISCQVDGLKDGSYYNFPLYAQGNTSMGVLQLNHNGLCSLTFTMTYGTQTAATGANGETVYICFMDDSTRALASGQGAITVSNFKLEEGSIATPWCPNSSDALATTMGLDSNIEYDCSGYCNNGTRTGTFTWTSDTPKYQVSTKFESTASKIKLPVIDFSGMANTYTFAWWQYNVSTGNMPWGFSDGNRLNCYHCSPLCWNTGDGSSNQFKDGGATVAPTTVQNGWHHLVVTGDGTSTKLYIDGIYKGTAITYKALTGTQIWISGWDSGTSYTFSGSKECDFRIYATALSADDVLSLYQNSAYIDSSGNVYGAVYSEV